MHVPGLLGSIPVSIWIKTHTFELAFQPAMSPLPLILSFLLPLPLLFFFTYRILFSKRAKLPPSPPRLPIIGNLHQLGSLPHRSLDALAKKHGPLMFLKLGSVPTIVVSSSEMAREVTKTQDHIFASRPSVEFGRQLIYDNTDVALAPYGEYWRQVRKISVLHLLSTKKVQSFRRVREEEVALMIEKMSGSSDGLVDLSKMLNSLSNDVACRVTLGKKYYGEEGNGGLCEMVRENTVLATALYVGDYFPWLGWVSKLSGLDARMKRHSRRWDEFLDQVIDDHLHGSSAEARDEDLVDVLLSVRQDASLTMDNVKAIILDMFGGGTDTSYVAMEWTMAELLRNPIAMKRVQEEVRRIAEGKHMVEEEDISKMHYLRAVIKEVLRLHPPGPLLVQRESLKATHIQGYGIPAKTRVIINAWAMGRNAKYWDAPEKFLPERLLDSRVDFKGHDFHYIPFGAGRRICPGILLAISTIELAIANVLYHFDWSLPDGKNPEDLDMSELYGIAVRRRSNLLLLVTAQHGRNKSL